MISQALREHIEKGDPIDVANYCMFLAARNEPITPAEPQPERERLCAAIKAEDDYCVTHGDYMLDSNDCIKIIRGEWVRPDYSVGIGPNGGDK